VGKISGTDMVGGCKPGGLIADAEEQGKDKGMSADEMKGDIKIDNVKREPLVIVRRFGEFAFGDVANDRDAADDFALFVMPR